MFCKKCGAEIETGAAFCKECGTKAENIGGDRKGPANKMRRDYYQIGAIAASLLLFFSALLPYVKVTNEMVAREAGFHSVSLAKAGEDISGGVILLILTGAVVLFLCLDKKMIALIVGILNLAICGMSMVMFSEQVAGIQDQLSGWASVDDLLSKGAGYYLLRMACIVFLAALLLYAFKKREIENSSRLS